MSSQSHSLPPLPQTHTLVATAPAVFLEVSHGLYWALLRWVGQKGKFMISHLPLLHSRPYCEGCSSTFSPGPCLLELQWAANHICCHHPCPSLFPLPFSFQCAHLQMPQCVDLSGCWCVELGIL